MSLKFGVIILFCCVALSSRAQNQMLQEAFEDFASSKFYEYEEIAITWNMEGSLQADLNEGINWLVEGKPELAESSLTTVLQKDSSLWQAYYYRAASRKKMKKYWDALKDLKQAMKLHHDFYEGYVELAKVYHLRGQSSESEQVIKKAIQLDKSKATPYYLRGDINLAQNQPRAAIRNYQECLAVDSLYHDARIKLALIDLISKKNNDVAVRHLNQVLEYDSLQKSALLFRSILIYDQDKQQCLQDLTNLVLVSPNNLWAYYMRGMVLSQAEKYSLAFADFNKVIKATSMDDNNFVGQQTWSDKKIDIQNAGAYTVTRVYGLPEADGAKLKQAYCHIVLSEFDKSIAIIDKTSAPNDEPLCVYLKAVAYEHKGNHTEALKFYELALDLDNEIADAHKKRGIYAQELKQWDASIEDLTIVLRLNPEAFVTYKIRGVSYFYNNKFDLAIADYNAYLKYDSANKEIIGYRGMAYLKNNQKWNAYIDFAASENLQMFNFLEMSHLIDSVLVKGDTTLAVSALNTFTTAAPYFTEGFVQKFKIHMARNEWKPIATDITKAVRNSRTDAKKSDHAFLLTLQAMNLVKNRHTDDALKIFDEAIRFDKENALAYLERGRVWLAMGKSGKAESDFKQASLLGNEQAKKLLTAGN